MQQLCFSQIPIEDRAVYPIIPQLFLGDLFSNSWGYKYSSGSTLVTGSPETSTSLLKHSPFKRGQLLANRLVDSVRVFKSNSRGWVWVVTFLTPQAVSSMEDFESDWLLLSDARTLPKRCVECSLSTTLRVIPDYRIQDPRDSREPEIAVSVCSEACERFFKQRLFRAWDSYLGRPTEEEYDEGLDF